jgi:hypothetical protein
MTDTQTTTRLNLRNVPTWAADAIDAEADSKGLSREGHLRSIMIEYARRLIASRQKEAAK